MNNIATVRDVLDLISYAPGFALPCVLVLDPELGFEDAAAAVLAAQALYGFWASGDESLPAQAVCDSTAAASRALRAAVPDLTCTLEELVVGTGRVAARLRFAGTFTGVFRGLAGHGEPIDFVAVDTPRVTGGRVSSDWHLKDNLKLLTQLGAI